MKCGIRTHIVDHLESRGLFALPEWEKDVPCVAPGCTGRAVWRGDPEGQRVAFDMEVRAANYQRALLGYGLADMAEATEAHVRYLLENMKVVSADLEPLGDPERTVVKSLTMENGSVLHFGASYRGAHVVYIGFQTGPFVRSHESTTGGQEGL